MFECLCTYLYKSVDYIRSRSTPEVSEMCGALYKCIIIVDIIAIQALVAEFIIMSRCLLGLYVLDCSTCRSGGKFMSYVINLSYKISRRLLFYCSVLLTVVWQCLELFCICTHPKRTRASAGAAPRLQLQRASQIVFLAICAYKSNSRHGHFRKSRHVRVCKEQIRVCKSSM